jgi:Type IV secretion-system coupling protein DNA-binding domain
MTAPEVLLHGGPGLLGAFAAVQGPLLAGLVRSRAPVARLLASPLAAVPLTAAVGSGMAMAAPLLHGLAAGLAVPVQVTAGVSLSAVLGYAAGRVLGRTSPGAPVHQRGALVGDLPPSHVRAAAPGRGRSAQRERITVAGVPLSAEDEVKHFKFIGTTGTGKSTAIHEVMDAALRRGDRAVIADPDGGYMRRFYRPERGDVILNPFEPASARWDLFAEIKDAYDVEQLARSLIPDHEGADRSWRGYARTFFSAVTSQAHAAGSRDVRDLYRLLVVAGTSELRTLVAGTPAQPFLEEHNGRMFDSIRSVTASAVGALDYVSRQTSAPFSVRQWVRGNEEGQGGVLFMPYRAGQVAALRSTISAWMRLGIFEAMEKEQGDQRLWFVVDELDALGQIDGLKDALARLRKFGGRCVLGFQSVAQVSSTYGQGESQTIVENCGNSLILRCSGSEHGGTSQFASRLIGEREVLRTSISRSRRATELWPSVTRAEHLGVESAVMGAEIEQLPDLAGYLKIASQPQWLRVALRPMPAARKSAPSQPTASRRPALSGPQSGASVRPGATAATDGMEAGPY